MVITTILPSIHSQLLIKQQHQVVEAIRRVWRLCNDATESQHHAHHFPCSERRLPVTCDNEKKKSSLNLFLNPFITLTDDRQPGFDVSRSHLPIDRTRAEASTWRFGRIDQFLSRMMPDSCSLSSSSDSNNKQTIMVRGLS
jgi:hypothetical protein